MNNIGKYLSDVSDAMMLLDTDEIVRVAHIIRVIKEGGGTIYLFGNGGSHATASHFANDLIKAARVKAVCVGDMTAAMLAYGNDNGWGHMFRDPLAGLLNPNDGVIGISCGGNSENVLVALEYSIGQGNLTVGLTGLGDTTQINKIGLDALIHVRANDIKVQEDIHLMICHAMVRELQAEGM